MLVCLLGNTEAGFFGEWVGAHEASKQVRKLRQSPTGMPIMKHVGCRRHVHAYW